MAIFIYQYCEIYPKRSKAHDRASPGIQRETSNSEAQRAANKHCRGRIVTPGAVRLPKWRAVKQASRSPAKAKRETDRHEMGIAPRPAALPAAVAARTGQLRRSLPADR